MMKRNRSANRILPTWVLWLCAVWLAGCTAASPTSLRPSATATLPPAAASNAAMPATANTPTPLPTTAETPPPAGQQTLLLATTVDLQTSGLLDDLLPKYATQSGVTVQVTAAHSEQIFALGQTGQADVLLVASRAAEDDAMQQGNAIRREDISQDDFVLLGPLADPAGVKGLPNAADALQRIAAQQAPIYSTGLPGEAFEREQSLWILAQVTPQAPKWQTSSWIG